VPPATWRIFPPTETDPPTPTPTTTHPTWALAVSPLRIVNVLEAVTSGVIKGMWGLVELAAVFAGGDFAGNRGAFVDVGRDPRELGDFSLRPVVDVGSGPAVELWLLVWKPVARWLLVGTFSLLFDTFMWLGGVLWLVVRDLVALWLLCRRVFSPLRVWDLIALWLTIVRLGGVLWLFVRELNVSLLVGVLWSATT
jgi:hypothetical protein